MTVPGRPRLFIALLAGIVSVIGLFTIPVIDRDEARFVQATAQMLETGDFVRIRFQDDARNKKPAGVHWLQATATALLSDAQARAVWSYRLPSLIALMLAGVFIFEAGRALGGPHARSRGWAAGLIGVTSLCAVAEAHLAKTDANLMAVCAAMLAALLHVRAAVDDGRRVAPGWAYGFWVALGLGVLLKGPVAPILVLTTLGAFTLWRREWRWLGRLRPVSGALIAIILVAPWFIAIGVMTDGAFFRDALGEDFAAKLTGGRESHGGPPGLHLALLPLTFWPGVLVLPAGLALAVKDRKDWRSQFALCAIVPFWLLLELTPTKLPHYILPIAPALSVVAANAVIRPEAANFARKVGVAVYLFAGFALIAAVGGASALFTDKSPDAFAAAIVAIAGFVALSEATSKRALHGRPIRAMRLGLMSALLIYVAAFGFVAPKMTPLWLADAVKREIVAADIEGKIVVSGISEPSFVFALGTDTRFSDAAEAGLSLARGDAVAAVITSDRVADFKAVFEGAPFAVERFAEVEGLNYSKGDRVSLTLFRVVKTDEPQPAPGGAPPDGKP